MIVVHGAGPQITEEMTRRGIPVEFVQGRRRTSRAALEVVRESMEAVNASLCAAIGDARRADPRPPRRPARRAGAAARPGRRPAARAARSKLLDALAARQGPGRRAARGRAVERERRRRRAALALGLGANSLVFLTDVRRPLRRRRGRRRDRRRARRTRMLDAGAFEGGIVPKLRAAALAAASGITATIGRTAVVA